MTSDPSATSSHSPGASRPRSGCCQRTRASPATTRPVARSTTGWTCSANSWRSSAACSSSTRRTWRRACRWCSSVNQAARFLPSRLAWYIAESASRSSDSAVLPARDKVMPMLADRRYRAPCTSTGAVSISSTSAASSSACAWASGVVTGDSTTNSSPPRRATVSSGRSAPKRAATSTSRASPTRWPAESLTTLKSSRSQNSSASRASPPRFSPSRSCSRVRLGRPVRASCSACSMRRCSARCRAVTSDIWTVTCSVRPVASRSGDSVTATRRSRGPSSRSSPCQVDSSPSTTRVRAVPRTAAESGCSSSWKDPPTGPSPSRSSICVAAGLLRTIRATVRSGAHPSIRSISIPSIASSKVRRYSDSPAASTAALRRSSSTVRPSTTTATPRQSR